MANPNDDTPDLGPCCNCGRREGVRNVLMLDRRGPQPGKGWGCVVCGLAPDGAVAVVCDACLEVHPPKFVCDGYIAKKGRVPFDELPPGEFKHDHAKHAAIESGCPHWPGCGCGTQSGPHTCEWRRQ